MQERDETRRDPAVGGAARLASFGDGEGDGERVSAVSQGQTASSLLQMERKAGIPLLEKPERNAPC